MSSTHAVKPAPTASTLESRPALAAATDASGAPSSDLRTRLSGRATIVSWSLQLITAGILFQTLFFKFTAAEESVYIFTRLGMEPWGRIGSGIAELTASLLLLTSRRATLGALLSLGVISGAIMSHLTRLGIVVQGDGGLLFGLAITVFVCSAGILFIRRSELKTLGRTAAGYIRPIAGVSA